MLKFKKETNFKQTEIGEVPRDWEVRKIKEIGKVITGKTPPTKSKKYWGLKYPFITPSDISDFDIRYNYEVKRFLSEEWLKKSRNLLLPRNTPCFVCIGSTIGKVCITKENSFTNQQINSVIPYSEIDPLFVFYNLRANQFRIRDEFGGGGAAKDIISKSKFEQISLPYPPPPEQSRIATVLSWFDELIENKKRQNEILEKTATAIFKSWFVDFEPFRDGEFVYNEELGKEIPKGWEVRKIGEILKILYGKGLPERKRKDGPYPVIGSSGIIGYHAEYIAPAPSIVIGRKGNVGSVYLMLEHCFPIDTVFYTQPETPKEIVFFVYHFLKTVDLEDIGLSHTAVPGLDIHFLNSFPVLLPPQPILQHFHSLVEPLFQKIILNQKQIMVLRKIRDTLLPKLVFGKLRVVEI